MLERVKDWVRGLMDGAAAPEKAPERYARLYEAADAEKITAVMAGKLASLVFADSSMEVLGDNPRAALVRSALEPLWAAGNSIVAQALGKGGKVIVPVVRGGRVQVKAIDQCRMAIHRMDAGRLSDVTLLCGRQMVGKRYYYLLADYSMQPDGGQRIAYRACDGDGREAPLSVAEAWKEITPEMVIGGTDRLLLGYMKCPRDDRTEGGGHGVPITYGCERDIEELVEHMRIYRREFKLSRMMLGLDAAMWRDPNGGTRAADISAVRRTVQDSDDPFIPWESPALDGRSAWQVYAPEIRHEAMEARYQSLCRRIEMNCGLSRGILTERQRISYANRDEIRAAMYDTFCMVRAIRGEFERALADVAYAVDALAEMTGLTPGGDWQICTDWDYGLIESTEQAFNQNLALCEKDLMSGAELRQWALGGTLQDAERAVARIADAKLEQERRRDAVESRGDCGDLSGGDGSAADCAGAGV